MLKNLGHVCLILQSGTIEASELKSVLKELGWEHDDKAVAHCLNFLDKVIMKTTHSPHSLKRAGQGSTFHTYHVHACLHGRDGVRLFEQDLNGTLEFDEFLKWTEYSWKHRVLEKSQAADTGLRVEGVDTTRRKSLKEGIKEVRRRSMQALEEGEEDPIKAAMAEFEQEVSRQNLYQV